MRKIFTLLLVLAGYFSFGQQFNNEWIRFEQTYYKIKVARAGVYRMPKSLLDAIGIGNAQVQNLELWRNGQLVPFYPSVATGVLPGGGYIEFWGEPNDGKADKPLYRDPAYQHHEYLSLQTDTAVYFLSVNNNGSGFKVSDVANNVAGSPLPVEPWFMHTSVRLFNRTGGLPNNGLAAVVGTYVYSSSYDKGEFHSSDDIYPGAPGTFPLGTPYINTAGPAGTVRFGAAGNALNTRSVRLVINGTQVSDNTMDYFNDLVTSASLPNSVIASGSANFEFHNTSAVGSDRFVISFAEINYPRNFNFEGTKNFKFSLPARSSGYLLRINNFNNAGVIPVLYDLTNRERYLGDLSLAGHVQFALPGTANARNLVLVSQDAANINTVAAATPRVFTYFKDAAYQGDYLIISNPVLYTGTSGNNPVMDYKNYRQSIAGGGHKVVLADINELVDQFAFGISKHPLSIRNFLRYCRTYFSQADKPKFAFLIGRGMNYAEYQRGNRNPGAYPLTEQLNLVPTFGNPASDNLLSADDLTVPVAATPIGRLSAIRGKEIEDYLEKVKEYEQTQQNSANTVAGRAWMKNVIHVTGSSDVFLGTVLCNYMNVYKQIIEDTMFGAKVSSFCKQSTNPVEQLSNDKLNHLFSEGVSMLTYFGHSSSTTLEFNIDNPESYSNRGKYPVFYVNGCNAGNFFTYYPQRMTVNETLSEKFVLARQSGSIGFVASTHYGIVNYLNLFLTNLYTSITGDAYDQTLGVTNSHAMQKMIAAAGPYDFYARMHAEQISLNGDPAIKLNVQKKPDYIIEEPLIFINPSFISLAEKNFQVKVKVMNIGQAIPDSITLEIKQQYPDGTTGTLYRQKIPGIREADSITLDVPIVATRDKGQGKIMVSIDADNNVDEVTESNNMATRNIFIYEDEARPIYPYNYAITNNATQKLYASTANPVSPTKTYIMEIDTSGSFSSSLKVRKTVVSSGGILEFDNGLHYLDSTVYFWRTAPAAATEEELRWNKSSFMYINGTVNGFNQSTFYQHTESDAARVSIDSASGQWKFGTRTNHVFVRNGVYPTAANQAQDVTVSVNGASGEMESVCGVSGLIFYVLDPVSLRPWFNAEAGQNGQYGSRPVCDVSRRHQFQFNYSPTDTALRRKVVQFMDMIPAGHFVVVNNIFHSEEWRNTYSPQLMADTSYMGSNNSIYHRLLEQGFTMVDSINRNRSFIFLYQKGRLGYFIPKFTLSKGIDDRITLSTDIVTPDTLGYVTSPRFGPAKGWKEVIWNGESLESPSTDNVLLDIIGIDYNNTETLLYRIDKSTHNFDISSVDPKQYPFIQLKMRNADSLKLTPYQLKYWRVLYDPVPEGGLAANLFYSGKDTAELGEVVKYGIAFKNVSATPFDSVLVKVNITDRGNNSHALQSAKFKPLVSGDTITVQLDINTRDYPENNTLQIDVNPDNDQPEHHHFNNIMFKQLYVKPDKTNPVLDVTFDGIHILNKDIVSAKPHIQIKLKDEAKFMLLNDTAISSVEIRYPDGNARTYHFDGDTLRFIPATSGSDNTAMIDFTPQFLDQTNPEGDEYELIVKGKDRSGNGAGSIGYRVGFRVIAKPMISNLLNYPNPFSTSTAFVFTLTGSEIPQNIRIQILTVTGKIVREITMNELGPIRIGRNITEFKWDGTDQYGQKLGNGVYLYRVITSMNGRPMDKYKAQGDQTDKFFNNGYGKMYLMR